MNIQDIIGLDTNKTKEVADKLNLLLADYSLFYQNVRGYHWNIKGDEFFELHEKFEELYNSLAEKIDEIAERLVTLGYTPWHKQSVYLEKASIKESDTQKDGRKSVESILRAFKSILASQRALLDLSDNIGDEGTNALMSDYISEQEKTVWMYAAFLSE